MPSRLGSLRVRICASDRPAAVRLRIRHLDPRPGRAGDQAKRHRQHAAGQNLTLIERAEAGNLELLSIQAIQLSA